MLNIFNKTKLLFTFFLLFMSLINISDSWSNDDEIFIRAEIYYYDWDVLTRYALSPEDVRKRYKIKILIADKEEVAKFVKWLQLDNMRPVSQPEEEDARLVVDLFKTKGIRESYYASRFNLISEDSLRKRQIDKKFKSLFFFKQPIE